MRFTLALVLLLLPAAAFAQTFDGPNNPIPVQKCVQTSAGEACTPVRDGAGFAAANGYTRADRGDMAVSQRAQAAPQGSAPVLTR